MMLSNTLSDLDKLNQGEYQLSPSKIDMTHVYMLFSKAASTTYAELPMVELDEVAEGVRERLNHPVSRWDCFKWICF